MCWKLTSGNSSNTSTGGAVPRQVLIHGAIRGEVFQCSSRLHPWRPTRLLCAVVVYLRHARQYSIPKKSQNLNLKEGKYTNEPMLWLK